MARYFNVEIMIYSNMNRYWSMFVSTGEECYSPDDYVRKRKNPNKGTVYLIHKRAASGKGYHYNILS